MPRPICLSVAAVFLVAASVGVAGASLRPPAVSVANASAAQDAGTIVFTVRLSRRISVPLIKNSTPADDEVFYLILSRPTNARIAGSQAQGKILAHDLPAAFKARALLTGEPGQGAGEFTMTLDAAKGEASFALTVAGLSEAPGHGHIHSAKVSTLGVNIYPLPPKDGSVTGTLVLARKLIIDMHEDPGSYIIEIHSPTFSSTIRGVLSLVAG